MADKPTNISNLIEALTIALKYGDKSYPLHCEHDCLWLCVDSTKFSEDDKAKLDEYGFFEDEGDECFKSFGYGSA